MSESNFEITTVRLINACDVALIPETWLQSSKFEMWLSPDPRFLFVKEKREGSKQPPTVIPLSNVAYFLIKKFPEPDKKEVKAKK